MPLISSLLVKKPKYSTFSLSKTVRTTMAPGWVYPIYHKLMYTGDRFRFDIRTFLRTNPVFAPVMGSYKLRIATFVSSLNCYIPTFDYNRNDVDLRRVALPVFAMDIINSATAGNTTDGEGGTLYKYAGAFAAGKGEGFIGHYGVNETSLFKYFGYPRGWCPSSAAGYGEDPSVPGASQNVLYKTAIPWMMYMDCIRNYFINPQESTYPICLETSESSSPNGWKYSTSASGPKRLKVSDIDKGLQAIRDALTAAYDGGNNDPVPVDSIIRQTFGFDPTGYFAHGTDIGNTDSIKNHANPWSLDHGLLCSATYDPDINNNWMSVMNYNAYSDVSISVSNIMGSTGSFTYEQLIRGSRLYDFAIRDAASGGRYSDILYSQFGVEVRGDMHIPQLIHTMEVPISFEDITSMADSSGDPDTPDSGNGAKLGEQGGVGRGFGSCRPFVINNSSRGPAYVMVMAWIVPNVDYSQDMEVDKDYMFADEFYYPSFDNYALQPRMFEQLEASPAIVDYSKDLMSDEALMYNAVGYPSTTPMGYQPAYAEMMTDYNEVHGLFCSSLDYWVIARRWPRITSGSGYYGVDATAYVCGSSALIQAYNYPFSVQDGDDNFQVQFRFDVKATRPKSKAAVPHVL